MVCLQVAPGVPQVLQGALVGLEAPVSPPRCRLSVPSLTFGLCSTSAFAAVSYLACFPGRECRGKFPARHAGHQLQASAQALNKRRLVGPHGVCCPSACLHCNCRLATLYVRFLTTVFLQVEWEVQELGVVLEALEVPEESQAEALPSDLACDRTAPVMAVCCLGLQNSMHRRCSETLSMLNDCSSRRADLLACPVKRHITCS